MSNKSSRGFSPILAFILGFLLALIVAAGAVVGVVYAVLNYKLDKLEFNKDENGEYVYINADPNGETATALQLVQKIIDMSSDFSSLSVNEVEKVIPAASALADKLADAFSEYVEIDRAALKNTAFSALGDFIGDAVMDAQPATLLKKFGSDIDGNEILELILYDENSEPVTLRELADGDALDAFYNKPVLDLVDGDDELTNKVLDGLTFGDLLDGADFGGIIDELTLADFMEVPLNFELDGRLSTSDAVLAYVVYGITDIRAGDDGCYYGVYNPVGGEKTECVITVEFNEKTVISEVHAGGLKIEGTAVKDVSARVSGLTSDMTIGQLMGVSDNKILRAISHSTIKTLSADINSLAVNELYADNIYGADPSAQNPEPVELRLAVADGAGEGEIRFNADYLYYIKTAENEYKLVNAGTPRAGKITASEFEENKYYTYGPANAMWKILLYSDDGETAFSVNGLTAIADNITSNIRNSTMRDLDAAGIVNMGDSLDNPIKGTDKTIGEITLSELLLLFVSMTA